MKTAKKMKNDQSQTKIKVHQLNRKILARYLYSSLDPLQQKNTLAADHAKQKPKLTVSKYDVIKSQKTAYLNQDQHKTLRFWKDRKDKPIRHLTASDFI